MTIVTWGNVPGTLAGGGLAARYPGFNIFLIGSLTPSIGMISSALNGWPVAWALLRGVGGSIQPGVVMAVGTLSARPENRAVGRGLFYTIYYLGGTFTPTLCGMVANAPREGFEGWVVGRHCHLRVDDCTLSSSPGAGRPRRMLTGHDVNRQIVRQISDVPVIYTYRLMTSLLW